MINPKETAWNHLSCTGQKETHGTLFSSERTWIARIKKLAAEYPDDVTITAENQDGSLVAHIPIKWFRITPRWTRVMTDDQRKTAAERLAAHNASKKNAP